MNPFIMSFVLIISFSGFFYFFNKKLQIILALQPETRWDNVVQRFKEVASLGFLQKQLIKGDWKSGLMHAGIFYGFTTLLLRKIQLIVIGFDADFVYPGLLGSLYATIKDAIELVVVAALIYGFTRRFFTKPRRLEPNREAVVILTLIMGIMVTDFLYDGFKFAYMAPSESYRVALDLTSHDPLVHERHDAFVGHAIATAIEGMELNLTTLKAGFHGFYWIQILLVFSFLVYLPIGEHFHIITALPAVFLGRRPPLNQVPAVDLEAVMAAMDDESESKEGAEEPVVGITHAGHLLWKDALDAFTCTECGRCKDSCPTFLTDKPLSLKWVNDALKHHLVDQRQALIAKNHDSLPALVGEIIKPETLWACTTCGYCEVACPISLEHLGKFYKMRQYQVMMETEFPEELQDVFGNYESQGNPWGLNSATRGDWAKGMEVSKVAEVETPQELDFLFYVGSAQSFDNRNQKVAKAFTKILQAAGLRFAILGDEEGSTGECVRRAGNEMLFQELAQSLVETINGTQVNTIVTCDPHAYNSLKNEYPEFGGHWRVIHHTELISDLLQQGKIKVSPSFEKVIYHEPCYIARHNGIYDQPRQILKALSKDEPMEFPMNREKALCCGAGGARMWMEETIGSRINFTRVQQALDGPVQPNTIATACPYCTIMITDGVAHFDKEEAIQTKDIAELVAEALVTQV